MKLNKILNVIFAIALFAAFIGAVETLCNGADMISYTTLYKFDKKYNYEVVESFNDFQKPVGIALLISSLIGLFGVAAGVVFIATKNKVAKSVSLGVMCAALLAFVGCIIATYCIWVKTYDANMYNTYISSSFEEYKEKIRFPMIIGTVATEFTLYSASMMLFVQNLVCFAVISAISVFEFVKFLLGNKKAKNEIVAPVENSEATEEIPVENNTEEK